MLSLQSPLDMHLHLREQDMLRTVAPLTAKSFAAAVVMPNLLQPVNSLDKVRAYCSAIKGAISTACEDVVFTPWMTLFFRNYSRAELIAARPEIIGVKLYPAGITTQSEAGVRDFDAIAATVALLEELDIPLLVHGESSGFVMDREAEFLQVYADLIRNFPRLRLVMEHISTAAALEFLDKHEQMAATVTLHHLMLTLDDMAGGLLQPHLFCKPIAKTPRDRDALRRAVLAGHPRLIFGSDSAPHPRHTKECCGCAAGIFSAPVALPMLAQIFDQAGRLEALQAFVRDNGLRFYGITPPDKTVCLQRKPWRVPENYGPVRPFLAGEELQWQLVDAEV
ncbi:MAG: dihydroorotase [bacterium]|nr:dihydroorotase [bacterium]